MLCIIVYVRWQVLIDSARAAPRALDDADAPSWTRVSDDLRRSAAAPARGPPSRGRRSWRRALRKEKRVSTRSTAADGEAARPRAIDAG
jgi:hypothetical protein